MTRFWECDACGELARLVFDAKGNLRGTACCMATAHTVTPDEPRQAVLL